MIFLHTFSPCADQTHVNKKILFIYTCSIYGELVYLIFVILESDFLVIQSTVLLM